MAKKKTESKTLETTDAPLTGLTQSEVSERLADGRVNGDQNIKTKTYGQIIRTNAFTFFNALFLGLAIVLIFFVDKTFAGFANFGFLFVVIINFLAGLIQEIKAKQTIDKLTLLSQPKVTVIRDGKEESITLESIVIDDLIILNSGNQICADSKVIRGIIEVDESLITGESEPVVKRPGDEVLSGSFIVSGSATVKAIRVGKDNYTSKISSGAKYIKAPNSVILRSVRGFIKVMAIIIMPLGGALFAVKFFAHGGQLNETIITVIGTLVGMIPSGLMLLTTGVFCISVVRMSSFKALAQDLYCTETLARVDMLCLDKTGTITLGEMEVKNVVPVGIMENELMDSLKNLTHAIKDKNPTALAIETFVKDEKVTEEAKNIIPFSSARKWSAAEFKSGWYVLGAAEFVLKTMTKKMKELLEFHSNSGNRVLVLCKCAGIKDNKLPATTKMLGYVLISDKIREEAYATLKFFDEQGVQIKIISGDNPTTVMSIAKRAGVKDYEKLVDATTLLTEEDIKKAVEEYTIFGRVTPDQKLMIIKALKANGHTVGMTGDGVNDVLALKEADCSVAMMSGSDAAKHASQIVLMDSNFASMPKIVAEGRRSINNLERSSSLFLVKTCYNLLFALIFMILQSNLPFAPKHYTLLGMVTIGIPSYFLALEPNKERVTGRYLTKVISNALPAAITTVIAVVAIVLSARIFDNISENQVSTMCLIVTATVGFVYLAKISYPFNFLRVFLMVVVIGIFVGAFFADFEFFSLTDFYGLTTEININMIKIMVPIAALSIPLFIGMYLLSKVLGKWNLLQKGLEKLNI